MNSSIKIPASGFSTDAKISHKILSEDFWKKAEFNRFGIIPVLLLFVGCIGGLAASYGAGESTIRLAMVAFPSIIALALILAVAPMRLVLVSSIIAILLDLIVLVF